MNGIEVRILPNQESKVVGTLRVPLYFGLGGNGLVSGIYQERHTGCAYTFGPSMTEVIPPGVKCRTSIQASGGRKFT